MKRDREFAPKTVTFSFPDPRPDDYQRLAKAVRLLLREPRLREELEEAERAGDVDLARQIAAQLIRGPRG
jgi:hypothetical protein